MDHVDAAKRSEIMRNVGGRDTGPERIVRSAAHKLGLRFRLHRKDLPGTPDLVFPKFRIALFVNGCFWHRHRGCSKATMPKTNVEFWERKFDRNVERDRENYTALKSLGWKVLIVWQCETRDSESTMVLLRQKFRLRR